MARGHATLIDTSKTRDAFTGFAPWRVRNSMKGIGVFDGCDTIADSRIELSRGLMELEEWIIYIYISVFRDFMIAFLKVSLFIDLI